MNLLKKYTLSGVLLLIIAGIGFSSCKKDYYLDSGLANPYFDGTVVDYFNAQPFYFDSVATVVKLAGMEDVFTQDTITFFSPTDYSIKNLITATNSYLYQGGFDTIPDFTGCTGRHLEKVPHPVSLSWRQPAKGLSADRLRPARELPRANLLHVGQSADEYRVVYGSDNGVKYVGYRQLSISYIPNAAAPMDNWNRAMVASCNILTKNGVVHVLSAAHTTFGFDMGKFANDVQRLLPTRVNKTIYQPHKYLQMRCIFQILQRASFAGPLYAAAGQL